MIFSPAYRVHYKINFKLAYPVMLSQLGHIMVGVVDSIMVGHLGEVPLAASSLANSVFFFFMCFGIGVSFGLTPLVATADGQNNETGATSLLKNSLIINTITGVLIFLIVLGVSDFLHLLDQPEDVVIMSSPYLKVITLSIIPFMLFQTLRQFSEGLSFTKEAMYITLSANLFNVFFNYLLIYGKWGFPVMGLLGAGWATFISRVIMLLLMVVLMKYHKRMKNYISGLFAAQISKEKIKELLHIGIPSGLQFSFEVSAFITAAIMMGWLGATALAAHQIAISLATISYMMASGLATAGTIRVGNMMGKKDFETLRKAAFSIFIMVIIFESFWTITFIAGRNILPTLYINDPDVLKIASSLMIMAALFQLSDGIQVVGLGVLRGLSDTKIPTVYTLVAYWVIGLPVGYLLGFKMQMGGEGVWLGLVIGLTITAVSLFLRFNNISKKLMS